MYVFISPVVITSFHKYTCSTPKYEIICIWTLSVLYTLRNFNTKLYMFRTNIWGISMQQFKNRFLSVWFEESVGIPCLQQRCNGFKCALCRIVNDVRALLSLSSDWSHSVYKSFDPTTAVSARCGHDWRHALVGSPDPVVIIFYNCEYAQPHVFICLFTIIDCTFYNAHLCEKHL